jgi:ketosteroid isomerase-like protein
MLCFFIPANFSLQSQRNTPAAFENKSLHLKKLNAILNCQVVISLLNKIDSFKTILNFFYMKKLFLLLISAMLFSCTQKSNSILSDDQKKKIQNEIQPVVAQLYEAAAHVDTTKLYDIFSFTDDFTYLDITGTFYDPAAYKQMVGQFWGQITSEMIAKGTEKYIYLSEDNVLWSNSCALNVTFKNGQQAKYETFGMALLFRKINNKWKIVFVQESTQEPASAATTK